MLSPSCTARFFRDVGEQTKWPPLTENYQLQKSQLCTEFPFVWLNNFKFFIHRKHFFHFKYSFLQTILLLLGLCRPGWRHNPPPPPAPSTATPTLSFGKKIKPIYSGGLKCGLNFEMFSKTDALFPRPCLRSSEHGTRVFGKSRVQDSTGAPKTRTGVSGFDPSLLYVGFVVNNVALRFLS
jgi:hypothetical protein